MTVVAICILTIDEPPNLNIWETWSMDAEPGAVRFFMNRKHDFNVPAFVECIEDEVRDTRWGDDSLVRAEQALLHHAIRACCAQFYCIVSGDSIPVTHVSQCLRAFQNIGRSCVGFFDERACALQKEVLARAICHYHDTGSTTPNWWVDSFAFHDEMGP